MKRRCLFCSSQVILARHRLFWRSSHDLSFFYHIRCVCQKNVSKAVKIILLRLKIHDISFKAHLPHHSITLRSNCGWKLSKYLQESKILSLMEIFFFMWKEMWEVLWRKFSRKHLWERLSKGFWRISEDT